MSAQPTPIEVFYSYASEDEALRYELEKHLSLLHRQGLISSWHHRQIVAGTERLKEVDKYLETASIILLLISSDFLASDYCYSIEMQRALERHRLGKAHVIPVFLRTTDWENAPFTHLQGLPSNGKAVTTWDDRDLAFTEIARELRRAIKHQGSFLVSPPSKHDREVMLKKVYDIWITGVLEQSLYRELLIELGLEKHSKLVENPWRIIVQETDQPSTLLSPDTSIAQAYDLAQRSLLILGAPGAGKTTLLLSLARTLLERANQQKTEPMPVLFHLSTWSQQQLPLEEWLVVELHDRYGIPKSLGTSWVKNKQLLLLLDGLDEVALSARRKCVITINQYRKQFPFVPLIVCSRYQDYLDLSICLQLHTAVLIQPLADEQIEKYLTTLGEEVAGLREALQEDDELRKLARTPLLLNILALAYQGKSHETINVNRTASGAQEQVFASYVERMLTRRSVDTRYSSQKITRWLAILAKQMKNQNQTLFSLEQMQPIWLPNALSRHLYTSGGVRAPGILVGVLISLIFICYLFIPSIRTPPALITFCILVGGLLGNLLSRTPRVEGSIASVKNTFKRRVLARGTVALSTGVVMGIATKPGSETLFRPDILALNITVGVIGLGCFLLTLFIRARAPSLTVNQEEREMSRKSVFCNLFRSPPVRSGGIVGGVTTLAIALAIGSYGVLSGRTLWDNNIWMLMLTVSPVGGLLFALLGALLGFLLVNTSGKIEVVERLTWTWQSLWQSLKNKEHLKNVLLVGLLLVAVAGLDGLLIWLSAYLHQSVPDPKALVVVIIIVLSIGFGGAATYWTIFGLFRGVSSRQLNEQERLVPNQGIRRSAWNGLLFGVIGGSICLLGCLLSIVSGFLLFFTLSAIFTLMTDRGVSTAPSGSSTPAAGTIDLSIFSRFLPAILVFALASCLIIALQTGWLACLRHYLLRWLLWLNGSIPWNYVQFLDYAAKRLLLRKAGGGYIFMHRLLLDYLASLDISLLEKERSALSTARENAAPNLSQASVITQRKNAGHKGVIVFLEVILLLALTCGVSLFGQGQQHVYDIASTATANAYATADSATATATAIIAHNSYFSFLSRMGTPVFIDPLSQEYGSRWSSYSTGSTRACQFTGGAYHVSQQANKYLMYCNASGTFSNFAFEVQLAITRGDCGGMAFRSDSKRHLYVFQICQNGTYSVIKCVSNNGSDAETLAGSNSPAIHTGLGQQNKIAIEASGGTITFYVNEQQIDQVQDSSYVSGSLGLIAYPESNTPTDVAYSNAKLWTL